MLNPATLSHNYLHSELTFRSPKNAPLLKYRNTWCDISQNDAPVPGIYGEQRGRVRTESQPQAAASEGK